MGGAGGQSTSGGGGGRRPQSRPRGGQGQRRRGGRSGASGGTRRPAGGAQRETATPLAEAPPPDAGRTPRGPAEEARRREAEAVAGNRARARTLVAAGALAPGVVVGVVLGLVVALVAGVVGAVVVVVVSGVTLWRGATGIVLRRIGAPRALRGGYPRIENVVEGLCATFGLRPPELRVLDDAVPNCCSVGLDPTEATLVVTTGLLEGLDLVELEAVVAHELAHIRREDIAAATVAAALFGPWCRLAGNDRWLARAAGPGRELAADDVAVTVVRFPPGLERALGVMAAGPVPTSDSLFASRRFESVRALWVDPDVGRRDRSVVGRLDATSVRAALLAER